RTRRFPIDPRPMTKTVCVSRGLTDDRSVGYADRPGEPTTPQVKRHDCSKLASVIHRAGQVFIDDPMDLTPVEPPVERRCGRVGDRLEQRSASVAKPVAHGNTEHLFCAPGGRPWNSFFHHLPEGPLAETVADLHRAADRESEFNKPIVEE